MFKSANWISTPKADHFGGASLNIYFPHADTQTSDIQEKSLRNFNTVVTECFLRLSSISLLSLFLRHWPMGRTGIPCLTPFLVPKAAICRSQKA